MSGSTVPPSTRSVCRPPVGLLGMLALVAAVEAVVAGYRADFAAPLAEDWRFSAWAAERRAPGSAVLCFGDSLIKYGVLPRVIEAKTGLKAYNLAMSGGTMPSAYFLLRRALDAGATPKAVVVDCAALMLHDVGPLALRNYPELATVADCAELAWAAGEVRFLATAVVAKLVPSYGWRFEIRGLIKAALAGRSVSRRESGAIYRRRWETQRGAQPMPPGRIRQSNEDFLIDGVSPASWAIEPTNEVFLDKFLALAASRGISVYWLIPPLCSEAQARRARRGADEAYGRLVRSKLARFANLVVLDARPSGYDDSVHVDHIHLDRVGATALTSAVATVLADRINGEKPAQPWVVLPTYPGRTTIKAAEALAGQGAPTVR